MNSGLLPYSDQEPAQGCPNDLYSAKHSILKYPFLANELERSACLLTPWYLLHYS